MTPLRRHHDNPERPHRRREDELEDLVKHGSRNFRRYRRRAWFAFAFLAATNAVALERAFNAVSQIQTERAQNVWKTCQDQNRRHDKTISELDRIVAELPPGPRRDRAERGRQGTVALIQALAPHQDCKRLVKARVRVQN